MLLCNSTDPGEIGNAYDSISESQSHPAAITQCFTPSILRVECFFPLAFPSSFHKYYAKRPNCYWCCRDKPAQLQRPITSHFKYEFKKKKIPVKSPVRNNQIPRFSCNLHALKSEWDKLSGSVLQYDFVSQSDSKKKTNVHQSTLYNKAATELEWEQAATLY